MANGGSGGSSGGSRWRAERVAGRGVGYATEGIRIGAGWIILVILLITIGLALYSLSRAGKMSEWWDNVKVKFDNSPAVRFFREGFGLISVERFRGDVWQGEVDEYVDQDLGLKLTNFEAYQPGGYYEDDNVVLFANIEVKSLPQDTSFAKSSEKQRFNVMCYMEEVGLYSGTEQGKQREYKASVYPKSSFPLYPYTEEEVECNFPSYKVMTTEGSVNPGSSTTANIKVDYDFETRGYLNVYFMDEEEKRALRSKGIKDILEYFAVKDYEGNAVKNPINSVYTAGPMEIGIGVGRGDYVQPIGLNPSNSEEGNRKYVGFTIKNRWDGEVNMIKDFYLKLPKGVKITTEKEKTTYCPFVFDSKESNDQFNTYKFDSSVLGNYYRVDDSYAILSIFSDNRTNETNEVRGFYPIKSGETRNLYCYVDIDRNVFFNNTSRLLVTQAYYVDTKYVYSAKRSVTVLFKGESVKEPETNIFDGFSGGSGSSIEPSAADKNRCSKIENCISCRPIRGPIFTNPRENNFYITFADRLEALWAKNKNWKVSEGWPPSYCKHVDKNHYNGRAIDITLIDSSSAKQNEFEGDLRTLGFDDILNEYKKPSKYSTGGHFHFEWEGL